NRNWGFTIVTEIVDKILKLGSVCVAESLHEEWHGVVRDLIFRHHEHGRLAEVSDSQSTGCAEDLPADVVPVDAASAEVHDANPAAGERERDDCVVDIADFGELRIREGS